MSQETQQYDLGIIRRLLLAAFTAEELRRFCQDNPAFSPIVDRFGPAHGLDDMVDEVVDYCQTHLLFDQLLLRVREVNPRHYARFARDLGIPLAEVLPEVACPYRGLEPFEAEHAEFYFGREAMVETLLDRVRDHSFVAVVGPSGCGKSSLVRAGLVTALRAGALPGSERWRVCIFYPGADPLRALAAPLVDLLEPEASEVTRLGESRKLADGLRQGTVLVADVAARLRELHPELPRLLLVADQFEELYTECGDEAARAAFVAALLAAAREKNLAVILTLRADFYGHVLADRQLGEAVDGGLANVLPMDAAELRAAIEQPALRTGRAFEPGLVERLAGDVAGEPGNLPLLEFALTELWARQTAEGLLTHGAYEAIGGVAGAIARRADEEYTELAARGQGETVRRVLLRLTHYGEATAETRRRATLGDLVTPRTPQTEVEATVRALADARLLVTGKEAAPEMASATVEVSHEALIRGWERLRGWLAEDRAFGLWRERLAAARQMWQDTGQDEGALLRGAPLAEAEGWLAEREGDLNEAERAFVAASLALREREAAEREAQREREVKRIRSVAVGATIFSLVLLALLALGVIQTRAAQQQERLALAGQLAAQSQVVAEELPQRRLLLAVEAAGALKAGDPPVMASEQALHDALDQMGGEPLAGSDNYGSSIMAFSPDGRWLATAGGWTTVVRLWDLATDGAAAVPSELRGHIEQITSMAFSPDGRWLATGSYDGTARLWDLDAQDPGDKPLVLPDRANRVVSVAFSPDGQWLATGNSRGIAWLWDLQAGDPTAGARMLHLENGVTLVAFSPDGRWLATADGWPPAARLWDLDAQDSKARERALQGEQGNVTSVASSPGGRWLASAGDKGTLVWDLEFRDPSARPQVLRQEIGVTSLAFSRDEQWLATGAEDGTARVWKLSAGPLRIMKELPGHEDSVRCVAFSPDARWLATGSDDGTARVWDLKSADPGSGVRVLRGHDGNVTSVAFVRDGQWLATSNVGGPIRLWDLEAQHLAAEPQVLGSDEWNVSSVAFNSNGQWLATLSNGHSAWVWDLQAEDSAAERRLVPGDPKGVVSVAFSPTDRQRLATGSKDGTVRLWDLGTGDSGVAAQVLPGHDGDVCSVAFSGNGRWLASGAEDGTARIWDLEAEDPTVPAHVLPRDNRSACALALSPDAHWLATANDKAVWVWDLKSSDPAAGQRVLRGHEGSVTSVAFSPDGRWVATGSYDGTARLWDLKIGDVAAGQRVLQTGDPTAEQWELPAVLSVAFDPDGRWLATGSRDGAVRLWDVQAKGPTAMALELHGPDSSAASVAYSPDGRWLAAGYDTAWLWRVSMDDLVAAACQLAGRNLSQKEWDHYFEGEEYRPTCESLPIHSTVIYASLDSAAALVRAGDVDGALASFRRAVQLNPNQEISAYNWAEICRIGSMWNRAADVLDVCEQAVTLRPDYGSYREHQGLARALTGDYAGAIEDFRRFIEWARLQGYDERLLSSREAWITELEDGRNPFDQAALDALWYDWIR